MKEQLMSQLVQFIISAVGILLTYALTKLGQFLNEKKQEVVAKKGVENYNRALNIARGMYYVLEDSFKDIAKAGEDKKAEMDARLLEVIPQLTQNELDAINKQIWNEFNEHIVKVITEPAK